MRWPAFSFCLGQTQCLFLTHVVSWEEEVEAAAAAAAAAAAEQQQKRRNSHMGYSKSQLSLMVVAVSLMGNVFVGHLRLHAK